MDPAAGGGTQLARCVGDVAPFLERFWAREPMHRPSADAGGFADLLDIAGVDELITSRLLTTPTFRLVRDGKAIDPADYGDMGRRPDDAGRWTAVPALVYEQYRAGATIVLQGLQRSWPPLARFCREVELELTHPVQANAYVTPPSARGLSAHADKHDVFVLQFHGRKHWQVYDRDALDGATPHALIDVELAPGDVLYIPTGFPHGAETVDEASGHITVGIASIEWGGVLRDAVTDALAAAGGVDDRLPPGFARDPDTLRTELARRLDELRSRLDTVDPTEVAATMARRFWVARDPVLTGQLGQLLDLDRVDDGWVVRRRPGMICHLRVAGDRLFVLLGDRELDMPAGLEGCVRRLASGSTVRVADLGEDLDEAGRQVLVRRLIREGLLERA